MDVSFLSTLGSRRTDRKGQCVSDLKSTSARRKARKWLCLLVAGLCGVSGCAGKRGGFGIPIPSFRSASAPSVTRHAAPVHTQGPSQGPTLLDHPNIIDSPSDRLNPYYDPSPSEELPSASDAVPAPAIPQSSNAPFQTLNPQGIVMTSPSLELPYADDSGVEDYGRVLPVQERESHIAQAKIIGSGIVFGPTDHIDFHDYFESEGSSELSAKSTSIHVTSDLPPTLQEVHSSSGVWR